jgi:hypothetical protein
MKLVNFKLIALLIISYSLALVALTPVSWLLPLFEPRLQSVGVSLSEVDGSIWQGQGLVREKNIGYVNVQWKVNAASLLVLKLPIELTVSNSSLELQGELALSPFTVSVNNVSGYVDEVAFKNIYQSYRADISGRLRISELAAEVSWGNELKDASGELSWSGGPISIPVGRSVQDYQVPTMLGSISSDESQWLAEIMGSEKQEYIIASMNREGLATLSIKRILATEMDIPLPEGGSSLFDISQQVF